MKIIGFNLTKILVEKEDTSFDKLTINQNINIENVKKEKIFISDQETLKIKFNLSLIYSENYAKLEFEGVTIILPDDETEQNQFLDSWKDKKIPEHLRIPLFNFIMNKCNIKALYLEDELGLPLHIPLPKLTFQKKE